MKATGSGLRSFSCSITTISLYIYPLPPASPVRTVLGDGVPSPIRAKLSLPGGYPLGYDPAGEAGRFCDDRPSASRITSGSSAISRLTRPNIRVPTIILPPRADPGYAVRCRFREETSAGRSPRTNIILERSTHPFADSHLISNPC